MCYHVAFFAGAIVAVGGVLLLALLRRRDVAVVGSGEPALAEG